jgi:anti-sigma-K factor RskA
MDQFEELIPAYALDALGEDERRALEHHLRECERCRSELRAYREAASSLAYATPLLDPPPGLRERVLGEARADLAPRAPAGRNRLRRPRLVFAAPIVAAAAAAAIAVLLVAGHGSNTSWVRTATDRVALSGGKGVVVVSGSRGALLTSLADAPSGKTYEAWVIRGKQPVPAGTFRSGARPVILTVPVRHGDVVAVTVEPGAGSKAPTSRPVLSAGV